MVRLPTAAYEEVVWSALAVAMQDRRARPLLERARASKDAMMVAAAEEALAQPIFAAPPLIIQGVP